MKLIAPVPRFQKWMLGLSFLLVVGYSVSQNRDKIAEASKTRLVSERPYAIDGDTIAFQSAKVRVIGIDAPDEDRPFLYEQSKMALQQLTNRDGGLDCSGSVFDFGMRKEEQCYTSPLSHGRINLACRFRKNNASVGATMVAQGYAVDYRVFSGGAYVNLMKQAAAKRAGLWAVDYEGMRQLAVQNARVPSGCSVGTIKP